MAATVTVESGGELGAAGNDYYAIGDFNPGTYATNGVTFSINGAGVKLERASHIATGGGGYVAKLDKANQKVIIYRQKDPGNAGGADIPLPEVANGVDLSGQTWTFFAVGQ